MTAVRERDRLELYVDGKLAASSTPLDPMALDVSNGESLTIGFGAHDYFHGMMSDVRLYGQALTAEEVAAVARER